MATATPQREYETIYVLRPDVGREVTEAVAGRVTDAIKNDGAVTQIENWGRRKLAYAVSKYQRGVYVYFKYLGNGEVVSEVERALRLQEAVMKFQTVKVADEGVLPGDAATATFEHIEEPEEYEEESYAQTLGLEHPPNNYSSSDDSDDDDSDSESDDSDDSDDEGDASGDDGADAEAASKTNEEEGSDE